MSVTDDDRRKAEEWLRGFHWVDPVHTFAAGLAAGRAEQREMDAKIAENHRAVDKYREQFGWPFAQREIAAAIRSTPTPEADRG